MLGAVTSSWKPLVSVDRGKGGCVVPEPRTAGDEGRGKVPFELETDGGRGEVWHPNWMIGCRWGRTGSQRRRNSLLQEVLDHIHHLLGGVAPVGAIAARQPEAATPKARR